MVVAVFVPAGYSVFTVGVPEVRVGGCRPGPENRLWRRERTEVRTLRPADRPAPHDVVAYVGYVGLSDGVVLADVVGVRPLKQ